MAKASDFEGKKQDDLFYFVDYSPEEAERDHDWFQSGRIRILR